MGSECSHHCITLAPERRTDRNSEKLFSVIPVPAIPVDKLRSIVDALGYYSNGSNFSYRVYLKVKERENWRGGEGGSI